MLPQPCFKTVQIVNQPVASQGEKLKIEKMSYLFTLALTGQSELGDKKNMIRFKKADTIYPTFFSAMEREIRGPKLMTDMDLH